MSLFKKYRNELIGIAFLLPNIAGFCVFILIPLTASFLLAFSNWNIQLHNMFKSHPIEWVGLENFRLLIDQPRFWQYLGNTLFLMMGIPFSIAGSLIAALLLHKRYGNENRNTQGILLAGGVLTASCLVLVLVGFQAAAIWIFLGILAGAILISGVLGGSVVYRTLFYMPHFTAGVATFILWKKMYNPVNGPINTALEPTLDAVEGLVNALPGGFGVAGGALLVGLGLGLAFWRIRIIARNLREGDMGWWAGLISTALLLVPLVLAWQWLPHLHFGKAVATAGAGLVVYLVVSAGRERGWCRVSADYRLGENLMFSLGLLVAISTLFGLSRVGYHLPAMAEQGLNPPEWLIDYHWAKPSIMIMALWAAIGSNNMILFLAGLSNIPTELYEASEIDGANALEQFWHVTWPQLAPFTFFIFVMSVIYGLQGGFEMARTMTEGGPAGATTTLSYFIYIEGFQTGRLGFASAVAWTLFGLVFLLTLFNVKFGNRYVND